MCINGHRYESTGVAELAALLEKAHRSLEFYMQQLSNLTQQVRICGQARHEGFASPPLLCSGGESSKLHSLGKDVS